MDGDCLNSGSNSNCSADINNSAIKKQSPANRAAEKVYQTHMSGVQNTTRQSAASAYQMSQKPGFITIYNQSDLKYYISDDLSQLIKYVPSSERKKPYIYGRVIDTARISEIERCGCEWIVQKVDFSNEYFVLRQVDRENSRYTGVVKIVKMTNATVKQWATIRVEAGQNDWIYYEKG